MRVFAVSDIHIDFEENRNWLDNISQSDYKNDILILAGDIADRVPLLQKAFCDLKNRFLEVFYVPGNHDLWVERTKENNSLEKFLLIKKICEDSGVLTRPSSFGLLSIVPLFGWYDYSFGEPSVELINSWVDYTACKWPSDLNDKKITSYFIAENEVFLNMKNKYVISFSHFLPRIDIMPFYIPFEKKVLYPVLGSSLLDAQIHKLGSNIHIYGHSHVNTQIVKDNTMYINNAFGYPYETYITSKQLKCVLEI